VFLPYYHSDYAYNAAGYLHDGALCYNAAMSTEPEKPEDFAALYRRAFKDFGASALWSSHAVPNPTPEDALAITGALRVEGDLRARRLAEQIEEACRHAPR
jgi:hypothetical protein